MTRMLPLALVATLTSISGCTSSSADNPTAPTALSREAGSDGAVVATASPSAGEAAAPRVFAPAAGPTAVTFPPRDQALRFRQELEAYYRDVFRTAASQSFVNIEGTIVWTQEYLRYRVNGCGHADGVTRVMAQIDGSTNTATCSSQSTPFPPRNEPFQFRQALEAKYRDGIRSAPSSTFVDQEGDIVWTQEYLRYRTTNCDHAQASSRVFDQLAGRPAAAGCAPDPPITPPSNPNPTPTPNPGMPSSPTARIVLVQGGSPTTVCTFPEGNGTQPTNCSLDGTSSTATGGVTSYQWTVVRASGTTSYSGATPTLSLPCSGPVKNTQESFSVSLTVRNGAGQQGTASANFSLARAGCGS